MSKDKLLVIKKYINKHFNKGFIYPSMSLAAAPFFLLRNQEEVSDSVLTIEDLILL